MEFPILMADIKDSGNSSASLAWTLNFDAEDRAKKDKAIEIETNLNKSDIGLDIIIQSTRLSVEEIQDL